MSTRFPNWLIAAGLSAAFVAGLYALLTIRMGEGDVYPPYSTFRADPLGTKAFFDALQDLPGHPLKAERYFRPLERLALELNGQENDLRQTLIFLAGEDARGWSWSPPKDRVEAIERAARAGARVVIAFEPLDLVPAIADVVQRVSGKNPKPGELPPEPSPTPADRRSRLEPPGPKPAPTPEKDPESKSPKELLGEMVKNAARREVDLAQRWGIDFRREKRDKKTAPLFGTGTKSPAEAATSPAFPSFPAETGKDSLPWHSVADFELAPTEQPQWRVLYSRSRRPVVAERDFGAGKLILVSDTYFLSNEALFKDANPEALSWLLGDARRVVFDEQMHGTRENPGLMTFVNRYRLTGAVLACLALALLYVWKNAAPLVPLPPDPGADGAPPQGGLAAEAGLPSLLRRAVGPKQLPQMCYEQWKHAAGGLDGRLRPTPERRQQLLNVLAAPGAEKDPAAAYRAMRAALHPKKSPTT